MRHTRKAKGVIPDAKIINEEPDELLYLNLEVHKKTWIEGCNWDTKTISRAGIDTRARLIYCQQEALQHCTS